LLIYEDEIDYRRFRTHLAAVARDLNWVCHAYCQMPNHYHLVVETPHPNLSLGMKRLNSEYAQWFNRRHAYVGHLFETRFYSGLIKANAHLLELSRYVVLNPVRAGLCAHPREWRFSSYGGRLSLRLSEQFGNQLKEARARYERFVAEGVAKSRVSGSDPSTRLDQPKPYVPAKRSANRRTRSEAGSPTTLR
jgi:REP element-mobilizing transposase RayT